MRKKIDKLLLNHKVIADDLEKYCRNKRLKKNIYKLDLMHNMHNGSKQSLDAPAYTAASCDYDRIPRTAADPVIDQIFKKNNSVAFQELMQYETDKSLFRNGVQPNNLYQYDNMNSYKLQNYEEYNPNLETLQRKLKYPSQQKKLAEQTLSQGDRMDLLQNLRFVKEGHSNILYNHPSSLDHRKYFEYGNTSMLEFKVLMKEDYEQF